MTTDEHQDIAGGNRMGLTIGAELRLRREERRQTIRDVADVVRIQTRYIEALEDDRIENLPGRVYALGFVRTYAEHLGLDANDMVERFKQEAKGLEPQSDLTMPEPVDEGKVPTAAIIIVAVVLAAAAYSAWYFMSGSDSRVADIVPEVPERLSGLAIENAPAGEMPAEVMAEPAADDAAASAAADPAPETGGANETGDAAAAAEPPPPPAPAPAIETPPAAPAPEPAPEPAPPAPAAESTETAAAPVPAPAPPPAVARDPVVYGAGNTDARVVITAREDAWVEVTDTDGAILFSRVLRKDDSYRVPDRPGATFVTGNAGGLAIEVDGDPAPALGPAGVVRKNVSLDADLLKAGQAVP